MKWGFWQISGWHGKWSKYHLFIDDNITACGRIPEPEIGSKVVFRNPHNSEKCKICQKVEEKRQDMNNQEIIQQIENIKQQLRQWQPPAVRRVLREQLALHEAEVAASDYGGGGLT